MILWEAIHAYGPDDLGYHLVELDRSLRAAHLGDAADRLRICVDADLEAGKELDICHWDDDGVWYGEQRLDEW